MPWQISKLHNFPLSGNFYLFLLTEDILLVSYISEYAYIQVFAVQSILNVRINPCASTLHPTTQDL